MHVHKYTHSLKTIYSIELEFIYFFQVSIKPLYFIVHINFSLRKFKFSFEIVSVNSDRSLLYFGKKNKKCYSSSTSILHAYHVHTLKTLGEVLYIFPFQYQINVQGCRIEINYSFILEIPGNTPPMIYIIDNLTSKVIL